MTADLFLKSQPYDTLNSEQNMWISWISAARVPVGPEIAEIF